MNLHASTAVHHFGLGRDDRLQRAVSIGDLNGDGRSDLLLGTTNADSSFASVTNSGSVSLWDAAWLMRLQVEFS